VQPFRDPTQNLVALGALRFEKDKKQMLFGERRLQTAEDTKQTKTPFAALPSNAANGVFIFTLLDKLHPMRLPM